MQTTMLIFYTCVALFCVEVNGLDMMEKRMGKVEDKVAELGEQMASLTKTVEAFLKGQMNGAKENILSGDTAYRQTGKSDVVLTLQNSALNDTDIEERVQALEFQMANVHDDITIINEDINTLDAEITIIHADQVVQDERLLDVEDEVETVSSGIVAIEQTIDELQISDSEINSSLSELDGRVSSLEAQNGTDDDVIDTLNELDGRVDSLNETVEGLTVSVTNLEETVLGLEQTDEELSSSVDELDSRVTLLESENGTGGGVPLGFSVFLGEDVSMTEGTVVVFGQINENFGNSYNGSTGEFTVPPGGAGLYYFYAYFRYDINIEAQFDIRHNGNQICLAYGDNPSGAYTRSSCGAVVELEEGDVVDVYYVSGGGDISPLWSGAEIWNSFSGFRISSL